MADPLVDNGALTDFRIAGKQLTGADSPLVEAVELVTSTEGGGKVDLAKAEDAAHASGDFGIMALAVRKDTAVALPSADGEYTPLLVDSLGRLHVNAGAVPAAARTSDHVGAAAMTDKVMNGLAELTPKFFSVTVAASTTDSSLVALVASKMIRVLALAVQCGATATVVTFESSTTTRIHKVPAGANGGQVLPPNEWGWFQTTAGASLTVTTDAGSSVEITGCYVEV